MKLKIIMALSVLFMVSLKNSFELFKMSNELRKVEKNYNVLYNNNI